MINSCLNQALRKNIHDNHKGNDRQNKTFNQIQESNANVTLKILCGLLQGAMFFTRYLCLSHGLWMSPNYCALVVSTNVR